MQILIDMASWMWSNVIGYVLLLVGVFFAFRLKFPQIRNFGRAVRTMKESLHGHLADVR